MRCFTKTEHKSWASALRFGGSVLLVAAASCFGCAADEIINANEKEAGTGVDVDLIREELRQLVAYLDSPESSDEAVTVALVSLFHKRGLMWPLVTPNGAYIGGGYTLLDRDSTARQYGFRMPRESGLKEVGVSGRGVFWIDPGGEVAEWKGVGLKGSAGAIVVSLEEATYFISAENSRICVLDGPRFDGSYEMDD